MQCISPYIHRRTPEASTQTPATHTPHTLQHKLWDALVILLMLFFLFLMFRRNYHGQSYAQITAAKQDLFALKSALDVFNTDNDHYPTTREGLQVLSQDPGTILQWKPYIERLRVDPWGTPYIYRSPGTSGRPFDLLSAGPDKIEGTADDIELK